MEYMVIYLVLAGLFGLFMAWGIGANDVANAMATSVGSRAITVRQAIIIAAIFEFAGAVLAGGGVTATLRGGMVDPAHLEGQAELLVWGMLAALLAAGTWLMIASQRGWPVSTTHSIIGAIIGFIVAGLGFNAVVWGRVGEIAASWVISPVSAGVVAYFLFRSVQWLILNHDDPVRRARRYVPVYMFLGAFFIALMTLLRGLRHVGLDISMTTGYGLSVAFGLVVAIAGAWFIRRVPMNDDADRRLQFITVERMFAVMMVMVACAMAFAHGSNDVANAVGPVAAVMSAATTGTVDDVSPVPLWVLVLGGAGIVIGLATLGKRVMATVGKNITQLTPSRGFAAGLAAAGTVVVASSLGLPISTTHTLVGAVLGVGFARGIGAININVVGGIFMSWIITLPVGAALSVIFFFILRAVFGS